MALFNTYKEQAVNDATGGSKYSQLADNARQNSSNNYPSNPVNTGNTTTSSKPKIGGKLGQYAQENNLQMYSPSSESSGGSNLKKIDMDAINAQREAEERARQEELRRLEEERRMREEQERLAQEARENAVANAQAEVEARQEQPSSSYLPYGDPRQKTDNPLAPARIGRYAGDYPEYLGETPELVAQRNRNADFYRGRELMQPVYTSSQQNRNNRISGKLMSAIPDEEDTEFYLGNPADYLDNVNYAGVNVDLSPFNGTYTPSNRYNPAGALARYQDMNGVSDVANQVENTMQNAWGQTRQLQDEMRPDVELPDVVSLYSSSKRGTYPYDRYGNVNIPITTPSATTPATTPETTGTGSTFLNNPFVNGLANIAEQGLRQTLFGPFAGSLPVDFNSQLQAVNNFYANAGKELGGILAGNARELFGSNSGTNTNGQTKPNSNSSSSERPMTMNELTTAVSKDPELKQLYDDNVNRWIEAGWPKAEAEENAMRNMANQLGVTPGTPDTNKPVADVQAEAHAKAQENNLKVGTPAYNDFVDSYVNDYYGTSTDNAINPNANQNGSAPRTPANLEENRKNFVENTKDSPRALEVAVRNGDTTYEKIYDDFVAKHKDAIGEEDARRLAYQKIYDAGYRPNLDDPKSFEKYLKGMSTDTIDAIEKATGNNFYTNGATYDDRMINMGAGGFDRTYDQERQFYDLTSELAGNAFANATRGTNYNTTPNILNPSGNVNNPLNQNGALQAALAGDLTTDQILHFYDANYSDLVIPEETKRWMASDSTHALNQFFLNNGQNQSRLEKEHGTDAEFNEALRALINANPSMKQLVDSGQLMESEIARNFMKAPVDDKGNVSNPTADSTGNGSGKYTYFTPSYGQSMDKGVKAPYKNGGYTSAELEALGNRPYTDANGKTQYEGYYYWNGNWYPVDQEKAAYYLRYGTYNGWDDGMRDYYNTFGTFSGYTPTWKSTGRRSGGNSYSYYGGSRSSGGNGYYYNDNNLGRTNRGATNPTTANQKQNRIYNIMKNWSF